MVVGLLGDRVHILGAVRDDTAVVGETLPARVVGDGVMRVLGGLLGPDQLAGDEEYGEVPGQHWSEMKTVTWDGLTRLVTF